MTNGKRKQVNILLTVVYILLLSFLYSFVKESPYDIVLGEVAEETVYSKETFENENASLEMKKQARNNVSNIYKILPNIQIESKNKLRSLESSVREAKFNRDMTDQEKIRYLRSTDSLRLDEGTYESLLNLSTTETKELLSLIGDLLDSSYSRGIKETNIESESELLIASLNELNLKQNQKLIAEEIIRVTLVPNEILDEERTNEERRQAEKLVEPVIISEGDPIILKGEEITEEKIDLIIKSGNTLGYKEGKFLYKYAPYGILFLMNILYVIYLYKKESKIYLSNKFFALLFINIFSILINTLTADVSFLLNPIILLCFMIGMYITTDLILINGVYIGIIMSYISGFYLDKIIYITIVSLILAVFMDKSNNRKKNFLLGVITSVVAIFIYNILNVETLDRVSFIKQVFLMALNGGISVILAIGLSIVFENVFKILTNNKLTDLADLDNPLLKRLSTETPGTFQHSLMASNLGEQAAKDIGADYLLVKLGMLYHDVGKLANPLYFKENQFNMKNPHDQLSPHESAKIIINHTIHGLELARRFGLPKEIQAFINEHHGDTTVGYFYHEARQQNPNVDIKDFTYPGKKPQSIETAIGMISDCLEAAVRSIPNKTEETIMNMIDNIIDSKVKSKQFVECDMTLSQLEKIKTSMYKNLLSIYHERIEYPEEKR